MIYVIDKPVAIKVLDMRRKKQRPDWPSIVKPVEAYGLSFRNPDFARLAVELGDLKLRIGGVSNEPSNRFEGMGSKIVHEYLRPLPKHILCDAGFWRWASLFHFFEIVQWRMDLGSRKATSVVNFGIGPLREGVIARMYLRAEVSYDDSAQDPYWLSQLGDIDFFRSHVFRTNYGMIRPLARAMIRNLYGPDGSKYSTKIVRELAKQVNRLAPVEALEKLNDESADEFVRRELARVQDSSQ